MSWEGYQQNWCRSGHYWISDPHLLLDDEICPLCGMKAIFWHLVNQTNCSGAEIEPIHLYGQIYEIPTQEDREKVERLHQETCNEC